MLDELSSLAEELVQIGQNKVPLAQQPRCADAMGQLQEMRAAALTHENPALVKCFDAIYGHMVFAMRSGEEPREGKHFNRARQLVGQLITALEGRA